MYQPGKQKNNKNKNKNKNKNNNNNNNKNKNKDKKHAQVMCGMYSRFSPVAVGEEGSIVMPLLLRTVSSLCIAVDSIVNCCEERTSGTAWRTR